MDASAYETAKELTIAALKSGVLDFKACYKPEEFSKDAGKELAAFFNSLYDNILKT